MKILVAPAMVLLSVACASLGTYPHASRSILDLTAADEEFEPRHPQRQAWFCWEDAAAVAAGRGECAADSSAAEAALSACIAELAAAAPPSGPKSGARQEILRCMERAGWRRQLVVGMR